jgi:hypothetical protein
VIEVQNGVFLIDYYQMMDFCHALERCDPKNDYVYLSYDGTVFTLFTQTAMASVLLSQNVPGGKSFSFGVESSKFLSLWKKLYPGSPIKFKPSKDQLLVSEDNISVKFPTVTYIKHHSLPTFSATVNDPTEVQELVTALSACEGSVNVNKQVPGVLIDNTAMNVCRVVKIGTYSFKMYACNKLSFGNERVVVSDEFCNAVSVLSKRPKSSSFGSISAFLLSPMKVGVTLSSGVWFYMPTLHDSIPQSYSYDFKLQDGVPQISPEGRIYKFDQKRLAEVLDLVSAVVGTEEVMLLLEIDGLSAATRRPVFKISAKTHNGCEASELVECLEEGLTDLEPLRINKKLTMLALKCYEGTVLLIDRPNSTLVVLQDETGRDVTFLLKATA